MDFPRPHPEAGMDVPRSHPGRLAPSKGKALRHTRLHRNWRGQQKGRLGAVRTLVKGPSRGDLQPRKHSEPRHRRTAALTKRVSPALTRNLLVNNNLLKRPRAVSLAPGGQLSMLGKRICLRSSSRSNHGRTSRTTSTTKNGNQRKTTGPRRNSDLQLCNLCKRNHLSSGLEKFCNCHDSLTKCDNLPRGQ